jgi:hypothetical protein
LSRAGLGKLWSFKKSGISYSSHISYSTREIARAGNTSKRKLRAAAWSDATAFHLIQQLTILGHALLKATDLLF